MSGRKLRLVVVAAVLLAVFVPNAADAACPTGEYYCDSYCYEYTCSTGGGPCGLCKYVDASGCASWQSCSCCGYMGLF